jgi:hypothetical protein
MRAATITAAVPGTVHVARETSVASRRLIGLAVAAGAGGVLLIAAYLSPSATGLGTHEQLRLPPCGWIAMVDLPCPTCGMTTAFAHAADGNLLAAFAAQPLGALVALAAAVAFVVGLYVAATGSRVATLFGRLWSVRVGWVLGAAVVASWVYKILVYKGVLGW